MIDALVIDASDAADADALRAQGLAVLACDTMIPDQARSLALTERLLQWLPTWRNAAPTSPPLLNKECA